MTEQTYAAEIYEPCEKATDGGEWGHHECIGKGEDDIADCACSCHRGVVVTNANRPEDNAPALLDALKEIAELDAKPSGALYIKLDIISNIARAAIDKATKVGVKR